MASITTLLKNILMLNFLMRLIKMLLVKRLKWKIYSIKNIDGEESNTEKRVNIVTEFNEFKDTLFNKKVVRHKMKRIQSKKHKIETCGWWQRICFK